MHTDAHAHITVQNPDSDVGRDFENFGPRNRPQTKAHQPLDCFSFRV